MKIIFIGSYNRIIAWFLSVLGFASSCIPSPVEYGMPHAKFRIKGTVLSSENELFIPGIKVKTDADSTISDENGNFELNMVEFPEDQTFILNFSDIDGADNGRFNPIDTSIVFKDPVFENGSGKWYAGETEKTIEIKMNPINDAR